MPEVKPSNVVKPEPVYAENYEVPRYLIDNVELVFDLEVEYTQVTSKLQVRRNPISTAKIFDLLLNGSDLELISVKMDGSNVDAANYTLTEIFLILHNVPETCEIEIVNRIYPSKNTRLMGLYLSGKTYCTQCEAEGFRRITYYLDHPDVLSKFTTTIRTKQNGFPYLLSNGNLIDQGTLADGTRWVKWQDPFRKPSYLFALVAGDFDLLNDQFTTQSGRIIDLKIYVEKGYGDQAHHAMYSLKEAMRWDEKAYNREYDLDIYMIVAIGDFNMGAMENKGLNIFNTKYVLAKPDMATDDDYIHILSVVGHEYFHNWSGNRVTCRDWFQLSLKEGLTIFRDQNFSEDTLSKAVMRIHEVNQLREFQFPEDAGPLAHAVRPLSYIEINNFYTMTIYNKGAEVLRMMRTILGSTVFRKAMDNYFSKYDGQAVTIEDFIQNMEEVSGMDLTQFRLWYTQAGTPIVTVEEDFNAHEHIYTLHVSQKTSPTPSQPIKQPLHIPIQIGMLNEIGEEIKLSIEQSESITLKNPHEAILHLTKESQSFHFANVNKRPCLSLLRDFSAPIKLNYSYSNHDLVFLVKNDTDAFNRWEAMQKYALVILMELINKYQHNEFLTLPAEFIELYAYVLENIEDQYFASELLLLPSEQYIAEQMDVVDVDAIHQAREFVIQKISAALQAQFLSVYQKSHAEEQAFNMQAIGKRKLKNRCLSYLMTQPQYYDVGVRQFDETLKKNMTDNEAALIAINHIDSPIREICLTKFYQAWKDDALVMDKWFSIQAATKLPTALQLIKKLMRHEAFDLKNPNKVYALVGVFGQRNPVAFHADTGEGYAFLSEIIRQLDKLNPQMSARMVKPLTAWQRYDKDRQKLMFEQLNSLIQDKHISRDLFELVSKSIKEE